MDKKELVDTMFYAAYHTSTAMIRTFLRETFPIVQSKHLDALYHLTRAGQDDELPGMVYGMICSAWQQLLDEQFPS